VCALLCAAPFRAQSPTQDSPLPAPQDKIRSAVVELLAVGPGGHGKNRECEATGFLVSEEGYILTSAHFVEEARNCLAGSQSARILARPATPHSSVGSAVSCGLVSFDELHDLALLKAARPLFAGPTEDRTNSLSLDPAGVEDGTEVVVTGHPGFSWQPLTKTGRMVRHATLPLSDAPTASSQVLILDVSLSKGNSGSPVCRINDGSVVAIVSRKDLLRPSQTVAVPIRYAIQMLDRAGVKWHTTGN
jgi:S1-C subfamily serine protease